MRLLFMHAKVHVCVCVCVCVPVCGCAGVLVQVVVEPSGAVGLAAVLKAARGVGGALAGCSAVGVVLCGGNIDLDAKGWFDMAQWAPRV
ncbi:hypothetical protein FOA52_005171 [Chlamydomonas sp. UWO 241]|nr:hypothetical protein FOA52_005171 [Chlamydomonas sp. UWO 241]